MSENQHLGASFDEWAEEEGISIECLVCGQEIKDAASVVRQTAWARDGDQRVRLAHTTCLAEHDLPDRDEGLTSACHAIFMRQLLDGDASELPDSGNLVFQVKGCEAWNDKQVERARRWASPDAPIVLVELSARQIDPDDVH